VQFDQVASETTTVPASGAVDMQLEPTASSTPNTPATAASALKNDQSKPPVNTPSSALVDGLRLGRFGGLGIPCGALSSPCFMINTCCDLLETGWIQCLCCNYCGAKPDNPGVRYEGAFKTTCLKLQVCTGHPPEDRHGCLSSLHDLCCASCPTLSWCCCKFDYLKLTVTDILEIAPQLATAPGQMEMGVMSNPLINQS
jgi:hypothetical protein